MFLFCIKKKDMTLAVLKCKKNIKKKTKRFTGLSIRDSTRPSCQKGSYLYIDSPIIE